MTVTIVKPHETFSVVHQDGPTRIQTGGPGLRVLAGPGYGLDIGSPVTHTASFNVISADLGFLHVLTPAVGTTLEVTLPPATSYPGKAIAFLVPRDTSGLVRFKATPGQASSLISDFVTDDFWIWNGEVVTLLAHIDRWQILDWRKNKLHLEASMSNAANIALTPGVSTELNGWIAPAWAATYLRHFTFALDGGSPQKVVLPRRGIWEVEVECFVSWSGTAPTYLWMDINNISGAGSINNRRYGDYIQTSSPTQALLSYRGRIFQANKGTVIAPQVQIGGTPTSPIIQATSAAPRIRLTEIS